MTKNSELLFAPELDQPVRYIERTRNYYLGLGYQTPYVWLRYLLTSTKVLKDLVRHTT
jgi:hypothetical protein